MRKRLILFVPGIKGSELWEGENKRWFPKNKEDLEASSILNTDLEARIPISSVNAYGYIKIIYEFILDRYPLEKFDNHAYDWRKPIGDSVDKLVQTIKNYSENGFDVYLLAHSMGGMLAKLAILELEKQNLSGLISRFISIGTPWRGAPDAFKVLSFGEPGIFSSLFQFHGLFDDKKTMELSRQFPSVYQLLPSEEYYFHENESNDNIGKFIAPDNENQYFSYYDVIGKVQSFYISAGKTTGINEDVYNKYMKDLQAAMLQPLPANLPHDCLIGCNYPTLYQLPTENPKKRYTFKRECQFNDGDGVVPLYSAKPPHNANEYYVAGQHSDLLALGPVLEFIDWCFNDKVEPPPSYIYDSPIGDVFKKSLLAKIMCPVDTTILDNEGKYITGTFDPSVNGISDLAYSNDTMYFSIGESKYIFLKDHLDQELKLKINSYDFGVADVSVKVFDEEEDVIEISFDPLPVNNRIAAELVIPVKSDISKATLSTDEKTQKARIKSKGKNKKTLETPEKPTPNLSVSIKNANEDVQKAAYRKVFSGDIIIKIDTDADELIEDIYFKINNDTPVRYEGETVVNLPSGEYTIKAFGKDIYNRPTLDHVAKFKIDDDIPETKLILEVNPEGLLLSFKTLAQGAKTKTFFNIKGSKPSMVSENEIVPISWGRLRSNPNGMIEIQYYSENEFGFVEKPNKIFNVTLGNLPVLMWEDYSTYVTPEMIWGNVFKHNDIAISDMNIAFIGKALVATTPSQRVPDNVKGVKFQSELFEIDVMYSEKYSLFFKGPPTEVLKIDQVYDFTFELIAERSKERILNSKPEAYLHPVKSKMKDKKLKVELEDGVFKSQFKVDSTFIKQKYKLVISDLKNTNPPLREISLTLSEEEKG
jgi:pimeloyl-ACP methyl ester carboxylesterase